MSGGHSEVVPRLPIPNRTVKRLSADDSAGSRVKVGHRQTPLRQSPAQTSWALCIGAAQTATVPNRRCHLTLAANVGRKGEMTASVRHGRGLGRANAQSPARLSWALS